ncbi:hypothetical protein MANES_09G090949v8 [Manihot esculenta]|uniref:Uncharacterized protein n=1 Tax=Manihot esculenta TaxID=3983 RepID=A0ACB7H4G7_MANES|nr:hypothetical protein MANES_09G090949v8 [Manihot esculenta]
MKKLPLQNPTSRRKLQLQNLLDNLFFTTISILYIGENDNDDPQRGEAIELLDIMSRFEFVFVLLFMRKILRITHDLSQTLQRRDQDIANVIQLPNVVCKFKHDIIVLEMDDLYTMRGRSRRKTEKMTNLYFYRVELFYYVIDMQFQELNNRFNKVNTNLFLCMACLDFKDLFSTFDVSKLIGFNFIFDCMDKKFSDVKGIEAVVENMVATRKHIVFPLVYTLVKLLLLLQVAIATVEKVFSAMHIIKNRLHNKVGDALLNDCLVTYIERDVFVNIDNEDNTNRF